MRGRAGRALVTMACIAGVSACGAMDARKDAQVASLKGAVRTASPTPSPTATPADCRRDKCIAITFDDGPGDDTGRLLDMLRDANAPSTFFVMGANAEDHPDLLRRMVAEGHEIANHTYSHPTLTALSSAGIRRQIERTQGIVEKATGVRPRVMRPPYGATDDHVAANVGLPQILWKDDTLDWRDKDSDLVARRVLKLAAPKVVILLHDVHGTTVDAMPGVLEELKRRGYTMVTVSQLHAGEELRPGGVYDQID